MAQPTNTFDTYDAVGIREDLADVIYNISPMECPFMSGIGRGRAKNTYHEWQTDELSAVDTGNAVIEGDDATLDAVTPTVRVGNRTQISDKTVVITGTHEAVTKAGRRREIAYQVMKKGKELKRDMEAILTRNQGSVTGDSSTARRLGSVESWLETNVDRGATGASGGFAGGNTTAATDGTQRALTEAQVKGVIQKIWTEGGTGSVIIAGPKNKQNFSAFVGPNAQFYRFGRAESHSLVTDIQVYVSDFGRHRVIADRFSRDRSLLILTMNLWAVDYLRSFRQHPLAKTGDSEKRQLLTEYTLRCAQEKGSGIVADLTTT